MSHLISTLNLGNDLQIEILSKWTWYQYGINMVYRLINGGGTIVRT